MEAFVLDENGLIINSIVAESLDSLPGYILVDAAIGGKIGDSIINGVLVPYVEPAPVIEVPKQVTMRQARLALLANNLLANVQPALTALPSPQKEEAQIEWDYSSAVVRSRPLVAMIGQALGLTNAQLDALFIQAATL